MVWIMHSFALLNADPDQLYILRMLLMPVFYYIIFVSLAAGILFFKKLQPLYMRWLLPFLALTLLVEMNINKQWLYFKGSTIWFYNIFTILEFCFYFFLFSVNFKKNKYRKAAFLSIPLYLVIAFVSIFFIQGTDHFHTISYRIASVLLIVFCYLFFRQLLEAETETNVLRNPMFWIATGLLFFYAGFFFYFCAYDYVAYAKIPLNLQLWKIISRSLNILLYSFFLISILCNLKPLNSLK
jgi:hypothetical protein